ncbi:MAG: hypothetical protein LLG06_19370, partial [Desulfobacteraceae bacterium]|nr:hypothetical protein [Desulfobacteraceae bacterium]
KQMKTAAVPPQEIEELLTRILRNSGRQNWTQFCRDVGERYTDFQAMRNGGAALKLACIERWAQALGLTSEELTGE